jgi:hypothetical protein
VGGAASSSAPCGGRASSSRRVTTPSHSIQVLRSWSFWHLWTPGPRIPNRVTHGSAIHRCFLTFALWQDRTERARVSSRQHTLVLWIQPSTWPQYVSPFFLFSWRLNLVGFSFPQWSLTVTHAERHSTIHPKSWWPRKAHMLWQKHTDSHTACPSDSVPV